VLAGLLPGLLCALLVGIASHSGWLQTGERIALDRLFRARGAQFPSPDIVLVVADDATVARANGWPLPRHIYGDLIRRLHRAGAKTIAFDIVFSKPSHSAQDDQDLMRACREANSVVSAALFQLRVGNAPTTLDLPGDTIAPSSRFGVTRRNVPALQAMRGVGPRAALQNESVALGHINAVPDSDGILRHISHLVRFNGVVYPSLALAAASHFLGVKPAAIITEHNQTRIPAKQGEFRIPTNGKSEVLINWIGDTRSFPTFSFEQVLSGAVSAEMLKGRIVLVGVSASAAFDHQTSPFSASQPAVEAQANAINDILQQRVLQPVPLLLQCVIWLALAIVSGVAMVCLNAWKSTLLAAALSISVWLAALLLLGSNHYFPVAAPLLTILLTLAASMSYRQMSDAHDLRLAEERYSLAVAGAKDGLWDWNLAHDQLYLSPRWQEIVGQSHPLGGSPDEWLSRVHDGDREQLKADIETHLAGHSPHLENEHRLQHRDGSYRWVLCRGLAVRNAKGKAVRMAGSLSDVTERRQSEEQARFDALHDSLTRLPNRTFLLNLLLRAIEHKKRHPQDDFALLFLDIDRFKLVNDSFGHAVGDELLLGIAERLIGCLDSGSTAARLGGDEFAVLVETGSELAEVSHIAQHLLDALAKPYLVNGQEMSATASIGIVHQVSGYARPEDVLRDGEIATYRAKSAGRSRYEIFDASMHRQIVARVNLEADLRRALDRRELLLHYQPIVSLLSGRIAGFETLIRWQHADGHLVQPGSFIPLAEETGLIIEMDLWSLEQACRQLRQWHDNPLLPTPKNEPLFISVNLSRKLFTLPDLVGRVKAILQDTGVDASTLKLEVTESVMVENTASAAQTLDELKALGLQFSIDDFGTGYSSLSYLHQFPLDVLKIDRSFVDDIENNEGKFKIVWTIIAMARNLGMRIVAEGVETGEQLEILQTLTCDYGQGYLFSRPVGCQDAERLLRSDPCWLNESQAARLLDDVAGGVESDLRSMLQTLQPQSEKSV
jgi:diguanylate cyclase (GGDEF)-like protein/PAS domain S-box-containing protein